MKLLILISAISLAACKSIPSEADLFDPQLEKYWNLFKEKFQKVYDDAEEVTRRLIWEKRVFNIYLHNLKANMGLYSYTKGLNEYSDWSAEEQFKHLCGTRMPQNWTSIGSRWLTPTSVQVPDTVDWRPQGLVTPIKDQKRCGSCWAFSSTGSLEGQQKRKTGKLVSLSEQNLVDCSGKQGNRGCNGGWMDQAFDYVKQNNGIDTEESYPYHGIDEKCHYKKSQRGATITGYVDLPEGDEDALKIAVATVGPISVAINVAEDFMEYKNGIYDHETCPGRLQDLSHAVLAVGYGTEEGKDYWLVKNSWGESWGMEGYIKMTRNKDNQCGIATKASYPLV